MKFIFSPKGLAIAGLIASFILLTLPGSDLPDVGSWSQYVQLDKWVHIVMFAGLVWLFCRWRALSHGQMPGVKMFLLIMLAVFVYGFGMEFVQKYFIPNRSFDMHDVMADGIGCLLGFLVSRRMYYKK
ncbi:MAG: VanZ family protein [Niabella sp.]